MGLSEERIKAATAIHGTAPEKKQSTQGRNWGWSDNKN